MSYPPHPRPAQAPRSSRFGLPLPLLRWEVAVVLAVVVMHVLLDVSFLHNETALPNEDGAVRLGMAVAHRLHGLNTKHGFPPGTFMVTNWMWSLFGFSIQTARLSMIPHVAVYILAMAWAGRTLTGRWGGVVMALVAAGMPWLRVYSHSYFTDVPLTAAVALGFAALLASRGYRRPVPTVLVGVAVAAGMLSRWTLAFFLLPPLLMAAWPVLSEGRTARRYAAAATGLSALTGALVLAVGSRYPLGPGPPREGWSAALIPDVIPQGGLEAVTLAALCLAWTALLVVVGRRGVRQVLADPTRRQWDSGIGIGIAAGVGLLGCLWWYVPSAATVVGKLTAQSGDRFELIPTTRMAFNLSHLAAGWWMTPVWLVAGLVAAVLVPAIRRATVMGLVGLLSALVLTSLIAPSAARYIMPGQVFLLLPAFAWAGLRPRVGQAVALLAVVVGSWQVGWWHPLFPDWLAPSTSRFQTAGANPGITGGLPRMAVDTFPLPLDTYEFLALPTIPGPVLSNDDFDLVPALREAAARFPRLGLLMARQDQALVRTIDPEMWQVVADMRGIELTVHIDALQPQYVMVVRRGTFEGHMYPFLPSWMRLDLVTCWASSPQDPLATPQATWCLYNNLTSNDP